MARTVIARQHDRLGLARRRAQAKEALAERAVETEQFGQRFGLDAQCDEDGAELELGHAAIEHCAKELVRVLLGQVAGAVGAAADILDVVCEVHDCGFRS